MRWTNDTIIDCCRCDLPGEIDLDGVSAYLPYEDDDAGLGQNEKENDKSPDAENDIDKVVRNKQSVRTIKLTAKKVKGHKDEEIESSNETGGGKKHGLGGKPDPEGPDDVKAPDPGDKAVYMPKVLNLRIIQMPAASTYRVALMLAEDCPVVHISLKAIGDDGTKEQIIIKEYKVDKKKYRNNSTVMTLRDLKGKMQYEFFLYLSYSEKMLLELLVY